MSDERTWYEVLGVEPRAAKGEIKTAYQDALDAATVAENTNEAAQVRRAWQVLSDPVQRQRYDEAVGIHTGALEPISTNGDGFDDDDDAVDVEVLDDDDDDGLRPRPRQPKPSMLETAEFLELPTLGRRLVASLIDLITVLALAAASIAVIAATGASGGAAAGIALGWIEFLIVVAIVIPTWRTGQTLGKRFTYLMAVDRASGDLVTIPQALVRYIPAMAALPLLFPTGAMLAVFYGLSYAMGRDQVSLADRLAKTVVVIARYKPSRRARGA